jgi:hypothetical protein
MAIEQVVTAPRSPRQNAYVERIIGAIRRRDLCYGKPRKPTDAGFLKWHILQPVRRCGEHTLQVSCLGAFLSVTAQVVVANYEEFFALQIVVSVVGIFIMGLVAYGTAWFKGGAAREGGA